MTSRTFHLLLVLTLVVSIAAVAGILVWGNAPMQLAGDQIIWGE